MNHSLNALQTPSVSIVIPVYRRLSLLQRLLNSIAEARDRAQMAPSEVIVVWDGPDDPTPQIVDFSHRTGMAARCLFVEAGPAMKRNVGIAAANADIILCVDADCTIHPNLLRVTADAFTSSDVHAFAVPVMFEPPVGLLEFANAVMPYRQAFTWAGSTERLWWAPAATIALRKSTVEHLGGFWSVGCGPDRGEDVDLGLRWTNRLGGPAVATCPSCPSLHARETWKRLYDVYERAWRFGTSEGYLWPRHPAFRRRRMPSILAAALLCLLAGMLLTVFGVPALGVLAIGTLLFCMWIVAEVVLFRQSGLRPAALPIGLSLAFVFEIGRTLSLWRAGTLTGGVWFHHRQPAGEWRFLALNGWLLLGVGFLLSLLFLLTTGR